MQNLTESKDMTLSEAYLSLRENRPSVTAVQRIFRDGQLLGYLGADFDHAGERVVARRRRAVALDPPPPDGVIRRGPGAHIPPLNVVSGPG